MDVHNWPRHRKVMATPFNENVMSYVWDEALNQTQELLEWWDEPKLVKEGIPSVSRDARVLSLNIMAAIGFRKRFKFEGSAEPEDFNYDESQMFDYRDALSIVLDNCISLMLFPPTLLSKSWMPKKLRRIGKAAFDFKSHMVRMLAEESDALHKGEKGSGSLMTSFVRALDQHSHEEGSGANKGLSEDEIFGNMFVINFAGHDTTANTLAFTMLYLSLHPDIQAWVNEEVHKVTRDLKVHDWNYNELFPKLKRCRAILVSWSTGRLTI